MKRNAREIISRMSVVLALAWFLIYGVVLLQHARAYLAAKGPPSTYSSEFARDFDLSELQKENLWAETMDSLIMTLAPSIAILFIGWALGWALEALDERRPLEPPPK